MKDFFEGIKIRKMVLVYVGIVVFFAIISELPAVKATKLLDENLLVLLCNLGILVWFIFKMRKSDVNVKQYITDIKSDLNCKETILSILINIALSVGIIMTAGYVLSHVWPSGFQSMLNEVNSSDNSTLRTTIIYSIGAALIAPFAEEFMFRGVLLNRLKIKIGMKKAIILSSILFGFIHFDLAVVPAIIFGVCMCLIYNRTNNIFTSCIVHFINNFLVAAVQVISLFISNGVAQESLGVNDFSSLWLIVGIVSLIAAVTMSIYFVKINRREL